MKPLQAELWDSVTGNLEGFSDLRNQCQTPRLMEVERLFDDMSDKFGLTLTNEQQEAFYSLLSIADGVRWGSHYSGIALGLCLAKELQTFLNYPAAALCQASEGYKPVLKAEESNIKSIESYLKGCKR